MTSILFVANDAPYGSERPYNALRHALAVAETGELETRVFLTSDSTTCALPGQRPPEGQASVEKMLEQLLANGALVAL